MQGNKLSAGLSLVKTALPEPLIFGLDIGIASVGWCVLAPNRIVDLGIRRFSKAETDKEGDSLNLVRRMARLTRRRLRRRAWRLTKLARLLKRYGVVEDVRTLKEPAALSPWHLRVAGLDRCLSAEDWARVIYHLHKHRGFHWLSKAEEKQLDNDKTGEGGRVKKGLFETQQKMREKNYRTAAEMILNEFPEAQRNKQGEYNKALARRLLGQELSLLFERQRILGNRHAGQELEQVLLGNGTDVKGLFWEQKPPLTGKALLEMLGRCTFEKKEYRAAKASYTAEKHVWLTRLNNLRIVDLGETRGLTEEERAFAISLPYQQRGDLSYKQLKDALIKVGFWTPDVRFAGLRYPNSAANDSNTKNPETAKLISLPAWQALKKHLIDNGLETEWESVAGAAAGGDPKWLDAIATVLSVYKTTEEVESALTALDLPGGKKMVEALSELSFDKFHALSLKALRKIVPLMERGMRYDEAVAAIPEYGSHTQTHGNTSKNRLLPPFYAMHRGTGEGRLGQMVFNAEIEEQVAGGIPRNPVVLRSLNQARKVLNALVKRYGSPVNVHIEMSRDLSRDLSERNKIEKEQLAYRDRNQQARARFFDDYGFSPNGSTFEKYQLYLEQHGKCAYSLEPLDLNRVFSDIGYAEIDHALPYSRSFDNGKNNKVLVLSRENRNKGNRTPYEYLSSFAGGEEGARWLSFVGFVKSNKNYRLAKQSRLLRKDFSGAAADGFRERNLNDTRYICRFFKNYIEQFLELAPDPTGQVAKRCVVLSGQTTAFLRARWGLAKQRSANDRHHALDAAVVAACSHAMVKRLSDYARRRELKNVAEGFADIETGEIIDAAKYQQLAEDFPTPWPHFRSELEARLFENDPDALRAILARFGTYPEEVLSQVKPLFVSAAPQRRNGGAAHKDTIYAQTERLKKEGRATQKILLHQLKLTDLGQLIDPDRNQRLYEAIRKRLEAYGGKAELAFGPDHPFFKPDREGNPTGPLVRSVTKVIDKISGVPVRGGIARNDTMLRVDVFTHKSKGGFYLVPIYVHHRTQKELPNKAITVRTDEKYWLEMDDDYSFVFSIYPNEFIRISLKKETKEGYYAGSNRSTASVSLWVHDRDHQTGVKGFIDGIGVKTALNVEKFHVDILGNLYPARPEIRRGLA